MNDWLAELKAAAEAAYPRLPWFTFEEALGPMEPDVEDARFIAEVTPQRILALLACAEAADRYYYQRNGHNPEAVAEAANELGQALAQLEGAE